MEEKGVQDVDVLVIATGFDIGLKNRIRIENGNGETLGEKWKSGVSTFAGIVTNGFPNLFIMYGPQSPAAFANAPTCIEIQGDWIAELLVKMRGEKQTRVEITKDAEEGWTQQVKDLWNASLFAKAKSWYQGSNIPGKTLEPLFYVGGIPSYAKTLEDAKNDNYKGFSFLA